MKNYYKSGEWNAICDVCGFKFKSNQLKERWDGFMVCTRDYETRHPMDFLRGREELSNKLPWTRPRPTDEHVSVTYADNGSTKPSGTFNGSTL